MMEMAIRGEWATLADCTSFLRGGGVFSRFFLFDLRLMQSGHIHR